MKIRASLLVLIASGTLLLGASCGNKSTATDTTNANSTTASTRMKFSDSPNSQSAYLISADTLTPDAETALTGFDLSKESQADGSVIYTLKAKVDTYHDQTYTVKPGQQLYFIESTLGDDRDGQETNTQDDSGVIVDADGYVVQ